MYLEEPDQLLEQVPSPIMDGEEGEGGEGISGEREEGLICEYHSSPV